MSLVAGRDREVVEWASQELKQEFAEPYIAIGWTKDGDTYSGACIFNQWNGANIDISIVGPGVLTKENIAYIYRYAFDQIKATRVTARVRRSNSTMRKLIPRLGFKFEGPEKNYFGPTRSDDALVFALFPETANKWLGQDK